jgi:1-piperideine-2-carboxylate/1-pyrroline-2-carboxylate reductase [NAD(P)H]
VGFRRNSALAQTDHSVDENACPRLNAAETQARLPFPKLVDALQVAVLELADGKIRCPERQAVHMAGGAILLSMPVVADDLAAHKLITVAPRNKALGLPTILGQLAILDGQSGVTRLILDGATVTGRRTAAMSMLGLRALGPRKINRVLLIGTGTQARGHVEALAALYPGIEVGVRGRTKDNENHFQRQLAHLPLAWVQPSLDDPLDVVITCTTSSTPVYAEAARLDRLLIAVGAFRPEAAELSPEIIHASEVFVDDPGGAPHEAGDLIQANIDWKLVRALGEILPQAAPPTRPRVFKTVGCAAWDLAAARVAIL